MRTTLQKEREKEKILKGKGPGLSPRGRAQSSKSGRASLEQSFKSRGRVKQAKTIREVDVFLLTSSSYASIFRGPLVSYYRIMDDIFQDWG